MKYKTALELAAELFRNINREITDLPYITHLVGVSYILIQATDDEDVVISGLLHDVLEDVSRSIYSESQMRVEFGDRITDIVKTVTHDDVKYGKRESRKKYLEQIQTGSLEACLVSAADLLHNSTDIVHIYNSKPEAVRLKFGGERAGFRQWFWTERFNILSSRLGEDNVVITQVRPKLDELSKIHAQIM